MERKVEDFINPIDGEESGGFYKSHRGRGKWKEGKTQ
jgi:hypothetical protein